MKIDFWGRILMSIYQKYHMTLAQIETVIIREYWHNVKVIDNMPNT